MTRALALISGGLDSTLASYLIQKQGVEVIGIAFETPFFSAGKAQKAANFLKLPLRVINITEPHLTMLKSPPHGYGANLNPCIDCHALMLKTAGENLSREGAKFLVTGEVLGQRPFSQNYRALSIVAQTSGLADLILRPLSARLLPETLPEKEGWVRREHLLGLKGRSRKPQMALAREIGLLDYPSPAGGCLLTDPGFSNRLRELFTQTPGCSTKDIELLKWGRHFRLLDGAKVVVGRNQEENQAILDLQEGNDRVFQVLDWPGPVALVPHPNLGVNLEEAARICLAYSDVPLGETARVTVSPDQEPDFYTARKEEKKNFQSRLI
jgi:tRNA U34 2-thiouridine synthase MnmA/TrmU